MDSHQTIVTEHPKQNPTGIESNGRDAALVGRRSSEGFLGVLEVFIHQARDIHNICIYHKQDVYAKLSFTTDPENTVSTKTINGGGRNPVFNENLKLKVRTVDADTSLKCEIWMLSRVKNYLEDQLLGFALIPLSEIFIIKGKLEKEFSLSTNDMFHSPSGFVQLSLSYNGASPDVMAITASPKTNETVQACSDITKSHPSDLELDMIEFPDPKIVNEDQIMVSEYFGMPCSNLESERSESLATSDGENLNHHLVIKSFSMADDGNSISSQVSRIESPPAEVIRVTSPPLPESSETFDSQPSPKKSTIQEHGSEPKAPSDINEQDSQTFKNDSSSGTASDTNTNTNTNTKPIVSVTIEPEDKVVQQDIVDMYMKSMQQFTESLAKMKLPLDIDNGPPSSGSSSSDPKIQSSKNNGSRVFYGSSAFF